MRLGYKYWDIDLLISEETLTTKYKPDSSQTNEELVYDPMDNPSPLLNILEQEMAMRVSGNVSVYIENNGDISRLNQILKVCRILVNNEGLKIHRIVRKCCNSNQKRTNVIFF